MEKVFIFCGSAEVIEFPEIRKDKYTKYFSWGFYCTNSYEQACRWADRKTKNKVVNVYSYEENSNLKIKKFLEMNNEWLDLAASRSDKVHGQTNLEGPMADDTIWNFVNDYLSGYISREVFSLIC